MAGKKKGKKKADPSSPTAKLVDKLSKVLSRSELIELGVSLGLGKEKAVSKLSDSEIKKSMLKDVKEKKILSALADILETDD